MDKPKYLNTEIDIETRKKLKVLSAVFDLRLPQMIDKLINDMYDHVIMQDQFAGSPNEKAVI